MVDRLAVLLERYPVSAEVFHAGALCGIHALDGGGDRGQLHLVRRGPVEVLHGKDVVHVTEPSLLLYPRPLAHRFVTDAERGADLACANLRFDGGHAHPLRAALPDFVAMPLDRIGGAGPVLALLFEEAFAERCGRHALVNRLFEVVLIQLLRQLMESGRMPAGLLAGLGHPRLRHALAAVHAAPAEPWTLERMAAEARMSRSVFAAAFREAMGRTPAQYLAEWRIGLAQQAIRRGTPLKAIPAGIGYGSEAAFSRAFKAQTGLAPRAWRRTAAAV